MWKTKEQPELKLEDQGDKIVSCSSCSKPLFTLRPYASFEDKTLQTKYRSNCPFCNDRSFITTINGLALVGPIVVAGQTKTLIENADLIDGINELAVIKA